jgi:outer membrane protein insertion porin family
VPVNRKYADVVIKVLEFPVIKEIVFESDTDKIKKSEVLKIMKTKPGDVLNINNFKSDINNLRKYFYKHGIILGKDSEITLSPNFDKVIIKISRAKIGKIEIEGNTKTKNYVIKRELEFKPGDYYDFVALRRSYQNLVNTGYFKTIDFKPYPDKKTGNLNIKIKVEEDATGSIRFGGTYGSENGLSGLIEYSEKNFKGRGFELKFKAEFGGIDNYEFSYFNPRLGNKKQSLGISFFHTKYDRDHYNSAGIYDYTYTEKRKGFGINSGKYLTRFTSVGYSFYDEKIEVDPPTTDIENDHTQTLSFRIAKDIRDNKFYPTYGYYTYSSVAYTGGVLKGDDEFAKYIFDFRNYKKMSKNLVFAWRTKLGKIDLTEGKVEDYEKFHLGGGMSIRGYDSREFLGNSMVLTNIELRYSINKDFKIVFFNDIGETDFDKDDTSSGVRKGRGFGFQFKTPMGVIRLDWGKATEGGRKTENYFNFGQMF